MQRAHSLVLVTAAALMGVLAVGVALRAAESAPAALTGVVTSQDEGAMEGVLVSAKRAGSTITVTVVTDARGRYAFPARPSAAGLATP